MEILIYTIKIRYQPNSLDRDKSVFNKMEGWTCSRGECYTKTEHFIVKNNLI